MKRTKTVTIVSAALLALLGEGSISSAQNPGWVNDVSVQRVAGTANGAVNVRFSPDLTGCGNNSGYGGAYGTIAASHPNVERMTSMLLAAQLSGTRVSVYVQSSSCSIGEVIIGGAL